MMITIENPKAWQEAIQIRRSRRSFNNRAIEDTTLIQLRNSINQWNQQIKGVRVALVQEDPDVVFKGMIGSYGKVKGAPAYLAFIGDMEDERVQEKMGYIGECAIIEATALGLGTCWVAGFFKPESVAQHIEIKSNEKVLSVSPIGYNDDKTMEEKLMSGMASSHKRKPLAKLCTGLPEEQWKPWMKTALESARIAPSAVNRQPWRFHVEEKSITVSVDSVLNIYRISKWLDCGIAMLHLEVGAMAEGVHGKWEHLSSPQVAKFTIT